MFHVPEKYRARIGIYKQAFGNNGAFRIPYKYQKLHCIASDGMGWEHVSVSKPNRMPTWLEMDFIKNIFWDESDCVMQLHVPASDHISIHKFCLHLWRPIGQDIPRPPAIMV